MHVHDRGSVGPQRNALRDRSEGARARTEPKGRPSTASDEAVAKKPVPVILPGGFQGGVGGRQNVRLVLICIVGIP